MLALKTAIKFIFYVFEHSSVIGPSFCLSQSAIFVNSALYSSNYQWGVGKATKMQKMYAPGNLPKLVPVKAPKTGMPHSYYQILLQIILQILFSKKIFLQKNKKILFYPPKPRFYLPPPRSQVLFPLTQVTPPLKDEGTC